MDVFAVAGFLLLFFPIAWAILSEKEAGPDRAAILVFFFGLGAAAATVNSVFEGGWGTPAYLWLFVGSIWLVGFARRRMR